jgi:hypothetical protein
MHETPLTLLSAFLESSIGNETDCCVETLRVFENVKSEDCVIENTK